MSADRKAEAHSLRERFMGDLSYPAVPGTATDWAKTFLEHEVDHLWAAEWSEPDLDLRARSICVLTLLIATNAGDELQAFVRGVMRQQILSKAEIREVLLQCNAYLGHPGTITARAMIARLMQEQPRERGDPSVGAGNE